MGSQYEQAAHGTLWAEAVFRFGPRGVMKREGSNAPRCFHVHNQGVSVDATWRSRLLACGACDHERLLPRRRLCRPTGRRSGISLATVGIRRQDGRLFSLIRGHAFPAHTV